jgi:hypothetical protein
MKYLATVLASMMALRTGSASHDAAISFPNAISQKLSSSCDKAFVNSRIEVNRVTRFLRIFGFWASVYFKNCLLNYRSSPTFMDGKVHNEVNVTKMGWATFWAIFSQTDLVALKRSRLIIPNLRWPDKKILQAG